MKKNILEIAIPTYNRTIELKKCLKSILIALELLSRKDSKFIGITINDNSTKDDYFPKKHEVSVMRTETIVYEVLHDTLEEAVAQVQRRVNERDWSSLLAFPPGSPNFTPIPPFTEHEIKDVIVKEIVLRPNPHSEGGSSDT